MASKRYRGKACAYCARPGSSTDAEHVLARSFLPITERANTPKFPACKACNGANEHVEDYAQTLVLLGGRHPGALDFLKENLEQRTRRRPQHLLALGRTMERAWERTVRGIALLKLARADDPAMMLGWKEYPTRAPYHQHAGKPPQARAANPFSATHLYSRVHHVAKIIQHPF